MNLIAFYLSEFAWGLLARLLARPTIANWLIRRAKRRPYWHLNSRHNALPYMRRWWLFNPRPDDEAGGWLPSIRVHHILDGDDGLEFHDHPWNARTIVLRGWYDEQRRFLWTWGDHTDVPFKRRAGQTASLHFNQRMGGFHRIDRVSGGGCYTLFICWRRLGDWGFQVDDRKVIAREFFRREP